MSITYTWALTGIKKLNDPSIELDDIIVQTYWTCVGTDENNISGTFVGAMPFEPDKVDPDNFTEYKNLTESQVLGWVIDRVKADDYYWKHICEQIDKQIALNKNLEVRVSEDDLPWKK